MLKIQIKSKETIKPSSPTSPNLPPIQLSSLDHTSPHIYTHILLFYSTTTSTTITNPLRRLKTSLSSTLTHFFPLAGRIQPSNSDGTLHVHCTDNGAEFIEALAEGDLESFLKTSSHDPIDEFPKLLPIKKDQFKLSEALLAVQATMFDSGGHVLGLSMSHLIADGASMAMFLKEWSAISRGTAASTGSLPKFHSSSVVFPPQPWPALPSSSVEKELHEEGDQVSSTVAIRRFVIDKDGVERLRSTSGPREGWRPTRVEAVSALAWRCLRRAKSVHACVSQVVNIRKRMGPALSEEDFGNLWVDVVVEGEDGRLEEGIREGVRGVDEEYVRRWIEKKESSSSSSGGAGSRWMLTSWCRMEFYKSDFGWGEPAWVGCGLREMKDVCMFIDAKDGQGIDLWVWLDADQMIKFETDPELLHFLSNF